jgi:hypothetical protein
MNQKIQFLIMSVNLCDGTLVRKEHDFVIGTGYPLISLSPLYQVLRLVTLLSLKSIEHPLPSQLEATSGKSTPNCV